jgi:hypothetical protein
VLYFFRTPPGVRVGRAPIDEDAIRLLEQHNPGVEFDWTRILKSPAQTPEPARREDRRDRGQEPSRPPYARPVAVPAKPATDYAERTESAPENAERATEYTERMESAAENLKPATDYTEYTEAAESEPVEPVESLEPLEAGSRELEASRADPDPDPVPARYARLGAEGLARLRARYAEVRTRIAEKPVDEAVREELNTKAERLNPDAWVTDEEVAAALEQYETVFEALRAVVGRPPRRRRRGRV